MTDERPEAPVRVLIADDDSIVRAALTGYVEQATDLTVIDTSADGAAAVARVREGGVDVVLMDVRMPGTGGIEAVAQIRQFDADVTIIVLTTFDTDENMLAALGAGANGFLLKDTRPESLIDAIRVAHHGGSIVSSQPASRLVSRASATTQSEKTVTPSRETAAEILTSREIDVLHELCRAASNQEIAERLDLSESTVKSYVSSTMTKLGCQSRLKVVIRAFELGLVEPPSSTS